MTDNTQPEAMRLANVCSNLTRYSMDAHLIAAELRRQHARIAELESELEAVGAGGVQALSAAPEAIAKLRHLYQNMVNGAVRDTASAKRIAEGLLAPAIEALERATPPAEQQAPKETLGGVNGWRDISTAPKDGSRFVATGHNYGLYSEVRHTCVAQWFRSCWMEASDWNETSELKYLTHWMPLPSPPDDVAAPATQQAAPKAAQVDPDKLMRDCLALLESFDYEDDEDSQSKAFFNAHINADWFFHVKHSIERQLEAKWGTQPQAGAVPQGWKAVPVNPTPEMWKAAKSVPDPNPPYPPHYGLVWDAMLAASPTPPARSKP